ncbi:alcohol dehydrogenase [Virgibacillus profundi]|uniref:Alcohol dehydrogenase n=1 Tax=Virgibacillus profundi TaxID=2024555 RepID=A0A2A2IAT8_9BACI|nr:SDR family oxidoreductase [Virgibacillus profundi]PAV28404.1 alcohol dehydrogenase [Virgibacillus profundi]PXY52234.1 SDR family NAD(P)-dependent oxidoreductase [Virgibacillus profundi]
MNKEHAVITGAGSGLGSSLAQKLSEQGFSISLLGRTKPKLEQIAKNLSSAYSIYEVDISSYAQVQETFKTIYKDHGQVDILINNAGLGVFKLAEDIDNKAIDDMIDINLKGTIYCTQAVLPRMKEKNEGTIVNVISTAGLEGKVNESVYCASKFGVKGFTESLLVELEDSAIKVLAAYMGGMKTPFWDGIHKEEDIQHLMEPDDVADIILANIKPRRNLNVKEVTIKNK